MAKRTVALAKKSLVVDPLVLRKWVEVGGYRNESEAVRGALDRVLAVERMTRAIDRIQSRGTFGRHLR